MAKTGNIDPGFVAAPFLGDSSHDPIEFTRRHNLAKYQAEKLREKEMADNTAKGIEKLSLDLKGWEDKAGFDEIMQRQDKAMKLFLDLNKKGLNLINPKTNQDVMAFRAINDYHNETKQVVDEWGRNKTAVDLITGLMKTEAAKVPSEQKIDFDATRANLDKQLKDNSIRNRNLELDKVVVFKPEEGDVYKFFDENKERIPKLDTVTDSYTDEAGQTRTQTKQIMDPAKEKEIVAALGKLYDYAPERIKNGVKAARNNNPELKKLGEVPSDKDVFISMGFPAYAQKLIDKPVGTGGGINFNFLGATGAKITPGELQTNDQIYGGRNYNQRYDFSSTKPFKVPTTGGFQHDSDVDQVKGNDGWHEITGGDDVEAEIRFYDPKSDMLVFRATATAQNPWVQNNTTFAVPRKNLPKADELPIKLPNGKMGKLKDILPKEETAGTKQLPLRKDFWSKAPYIPKSK